MRWRDENTNRRLFCLNRDVGEKVDVFDGSALSDDKMLLGAR